MIVMKALRITKFDSNLLAALTEIEKKGGEFVI